VDAGEPAAGADEALEGSLLARVEDLSRGAEEDDDPVPGEFAAVNRPASSVLSTLNPCSAPALRSRRCPAGSIVAKVGRLREDEDGEPRLGTRGGAEARQHAE